jgi:hypothetical protein
VAKKAKDLDQVEEFLEKASDRARIARSKAPEDPEIVATDDQLTVELALLREKCLQ